MCTRSAIASAIYNCTAAAIYNVYPLLILTRVNIYCRKPPISCRMSIEVLRNPSTDIFNMRCVKNHTSRLNVICDETYASLKSAYDRHQETLRSEVWSPRVLVGRKSLYFGLEYFHFVRGYRSRFVQKLKDAPIMNTRILERKMREQVAWFEQADRQKLLECAQELLALPDVVNNQFVEGVEAGRATWKDGLKKAFEIE